jgi:hypothetical protein
LLVFTALPSAGSTRRSPDPRFAAFVSHVERELTDVMLVRALGGPERRLVQFLSRLAFDAPKAHLAGFAAAGRKNPLRWPPGPARTGSRRHLAISALTTNA